MPSLGKDGGERPFFKVNSRRQWRKSDSLTCRRLIAFRVPSLGFLTAVPSLGFLTAILGRVGLEASFGSGVLIGRNRTKSRP